MSGQFTTALVLFLLGVGARLVNTYYAVVVSENIIFTLFVFAGFFTVRLVTSLAAREYVADSRKRYTILVWNPGKASVEISCDFFFEVSSWSSARRRGYPLQAAFLLVCGS
jgi:hypothetical protein